MDVKLKLSFRECMAFEELRDDITKIHSEKLNNAILHRENLVKQREDESARRYGMITKQRMRSASQRLS